MCHRQSPRQECRLDALESRTLLTAFVVDHTDDSGPGSLRQAILDANANSGADVIDFNISGASIIRPTSALPAIQDDVTIDGTSQPGYAGKPVVQIIGNLAGSGANGLDLTAGTSTIEGLAIAGFTGAGINIVSPSSGNLIIKSVVGSDPSGLLDRGNGNAGIIINGSSNNTIGGTSIANANIIADNGHAATSAVGIPGVLIFGGGTGNRVNGNSIFNNRGMGIDIVQTGSAPDGINLADPGDGDTGTNNLQNQVFMTSATLSAAHTHIVARIFAAPSTTYRFEFFANPFANIGTVQARTFVGAASFKSDASGTLNIDWQGPPSAGVRYTATATDPNGNTSEISLATGSVAGNVSGTVFDDLNADGVRQANEPALSGATIFADFNGNGIFDGGELKTTSDASGKYTLANLPGGIAPVKIAVPPGFRLIAPASGVFKVSLPTTTSTSGRDFALTTTAILSGNVFGDLNSNGLIDNGESGLGGWTVFIDKNGNGKLDAGEKSRITNSVGDYRFNGLTPGKYVIKIVMQNGFTATAPSKGSQTVALAAGQIRTKRNFGVKPIT
ncbi:MAG TPA: SdrD B-like domain-containing protein [Tepidisphaeraceae bacterium]